MRETRLLLCCVASLLCGATGWMAAGCAENEAPPIPRAETVAVTAPDARPDGDRVWVRLGSDAFELELALDPQTRFRGLSGRASIPRSGGMLFVFPQPRELAFVMRDCWVPIDIAYLDIAGRVLAIHEMQVETPRGPDEAPGAYESRLARYPSGGAASFAVETAGGRLAQVGLRVGQRVELDAQRLVQRAR